jgi:tetratricopeptide (TPR) repeat protein
MTLTANLTHLESVGLVRLAAARPELAYLFRHVLIQDAAYHSLLKADRRVLHQLIGETLEQLYPVQLDELAPVLAQHFAAAGDEARALKYFTQAGDEALRVYANTEAAQHYARAINLAKAASFAVEPSQGLQHLYLRRGRALELLSRYEDALVHYADMEAWATAHGDRALELQALMAAATIRTTANWMHDPAQGQTLLTRARSLAHELNNRAAEAKILWNLLLLGTLTNMPLDERIAYGEQGLALARELNLREQQAYILSDIWYVYANAGQWERAKASLQEAAVLARELQNYPMLAENLHRIMASELPLGNFESAIRHSDEAFQLSCASGNVDGQANSLAMVGIAYGELGQVDEAMRAMQEAMTLGAPTQNVTSQGGAQAELGWLYGWLGEVERGIATAQRARAFTEKVFPFIAPWPLAILAQLHIQKGELAAAEKILNALGHYQKQKLNIGFIAAAWSRLAIAAGELMFAKGDDAQTIALMDEFVADMRADGVRLFQADALHLKSRALLRQGRTAEAYATLQEARAVAEAITSRRSLWQILAALSHLEQQRGNVNEAQALRQQAREVSAFIAGHCPPEWREMFWTLSAVKAATS